MARDRPLPCARYEIPGVEGVYGNVLDVDSVESAIAGKGVTHLFFTTWSRQDSEAENCQINGAMLSNTLKAIRRTTKLRHAVWSATEPVAWQRAWVWRLPSTPVYLTRSRADWVTRTRFGLAWLRACGSNSSWGHPVVKAFNNIYALHLLEKGRPAGTPGHIALPVASDSDVAKGVVLRLIEEIGFDGVDAGVLDESWRQQPGSPVYTADLDAEVVKRALSMASKERTSEWRGTANSPGAMENPV